MKRICVLVLALTVCLMLLPCMGHSATATTTSNISGTAPTAGYVIRAKTITASTSGNTEVVAAVTGKKIKVVAYELVASGDVNVKFQSATNDIDGSTLWYLTLNGGVTKPVVPVNGQPIVYMQTNPGEALNVNLSASQAVSGSVLYYTE